MVTEKTDLLYSKFNHATWDIENWPDWMKQEAGIMPADKRILMQEHVAREQELAQESLRATQITDTPVKTPSLLDTLTTKQLDALLVLARYGWHSPERGSDAYRNELCDAKECVARLLFPSEGADGN